MMKDMIFQIHISNDKGHLAQVVNAALQETHLFDSGVCLCEVGLFKGSGQMHHPTVLGMFHVLPKHLKIWK